MGIPASSADDVTKVELPKLHLVAYTYDTNFCI